MNTEDLKNKADDLMNVYRLHLKEADKLRDAWYVVYQEWQRTVEEEKINAIVEERMQSKNKVYQSAPDEI